MEIISLTTMDSTNSKVVEASTQFQKFIEILNSKSIPDNIVERINFEISVLNSNRVRDISFLYVLKKKQNSIVKLVEKELKFVPMNFYRNLWLSLGMTVFGLPLGVVFGLAFGNLGLLAVGLPLGMVVGLLVGSLMDKKAFENGKQLDIQLK